MPTIKYGDRLISLHESETVLEGLLRSGISVPHSCRAGACQSCIMRSTSAPPAASQQGLREAQRVQNFFFSCLCRPESDLHIDPDAAPKEITAKVTHRSLLGPSVVRLRLTPSEPFEYRAGQFLQLRREDGLTRSYSIASLPQEEDIELHIKTVPNGRMSQWVKNDLKIGEVMYLRGPSGDCFYTNEKPSQPLLLLGAGTGLAPLYGILQDALRQKHAGPIHLMHGAVTRDGLYLDEHLRELSSNTQVNYTRCILQGEPSDEIAVEDLRQFAKKSFQSLKGFRCFICGDPELVQALKKWAFLAGASMKEIFADAFVMSPT